MKIPLFSGENFDLRIFELQPQLDGKHTVSSMDVVKAIRQDGVMDKDTVTEA